MVFYIYTLVANTKVILAYCSFTEIYDFFYNLWSYFFIMLTKLIFSWNSFILFSPFIYSLLIFYCESAMDDFQPP